MTVIEILKGRRKTLVTIVILVAVVFIYHNLLWLDLKCNGVITTGLLKATSYHSKSSLIDFEYSYEHNGEVCNSSFSSPQKDYSILIGKSFPVLVSSLTKKSTMLIIPNHFKKFNIPFPDSLKWVLQYVKG
ncbi:MAG: hypothetical protein QM791_18550 [Ferruginibacter sp.]